MVIAQLDGGLGNQIDQYSVGRYIAYKLNTEFKITLMREFIPQHSDSIAKYKLGAFNIQEVFATPDEVKLVKENGAVLSSWKDLEKYNVTMKSWQNIKNLPENVFVENHWMHAPILYQDIADIIKKEFTLKKPFNPKAEFWRQKITSAECSVSMHFRLGDYLYAPHLLYNRQKYIWGSIMPLDYYYTCLDILKQRYNNLTVFVFSNNLQWVKENFHLDVPIEFVEGCETDEEEFILMSLCKHNVTASSTFSRRASWFNPNPDKKIFYPQKSNAEGIKKFVTSLISTKKDSLLKNSLIGVPYDFDNQPEVAQRPFFSLLLVVNNDADTIAETLENILNLDYKYYEVIIIDNASSDGSGEICQKAIASKENVVFKKLYTKVKNAEAWNMVLKMAKNGGGGDYVFFLKGNDRLLANALVTSFYLTIFNMHDMVHCFAWLTENENGTVAFGDKKCSEQRDVKFIAAKSQLMGNDGQEATKLLLNQQINSFLGTKIYNHDFLTDNRIKFDEHLDDEAAELYFQMECFLKSKYFMYVPNALYVAPKNATKQIPAPVSN